MNSLADIENRRGEQRTAFLLTKRRTRHKYGNEIIKFKIGLSYPLRDSLYSCIRYSFILTHKCTCGCECSASPLVFQPHPYSH